MKRKAKAKKTTKPKCKRKAKPACSAAERRELEIILGKMRNYQQGKIIKPPHRVAEAITRLAQTIENRELGLDVLALDELEDAAALILWECMDS